MSAQRVAVLAVAAAMVMSAVVSAQQRATAIRGINGSWENYPPRGDGFGSGAPATIPGPAPIADPPLKPEHLTPWLAERERNAELTRKGLPPANNAMACLPEGMPGMMQGTFPMEILETPGQVTIIQEAYTQVRRVHLDEKPLPPEEAEPRFAGHSAGRWDGSTLVIETVGVKESVRFRNVPHSAHMRITERLRLVTDDILENRVTIDDPEFLAKPWTWTWMYHRWKGYRLQEYICEDNRYFQDPEKGYQRLRVN